MRTVITLFLIGLFPGKLPAAPANAEVSCVTIAPGPKGSGMIAIVNGPLTDASTQVSVYALTPPHCAVVLGKASPADALAYAKAVGIAP